VSLGPDVSNLYSAPEGRPDVQYLGESRSVSGPAAGYKINDMDPLNITNAIMARSIVRSNILPLSEFVTKVQVNDCSFTRGDT
jgi:hypothetical protein